MKRIKISVNKVTTSCHQNICGTPFFNWSNVSLFILCNFFAGAMSICCAWGGFFMSQKQTHVCEPGIISLPLLSLNYDFLVWRKRFISWTLVVVFYSWTLVFSPSINSHLLSWLFLFQCVEGENHEKAVELLKRAIGSVKLVVRYTPKILEEMEMRFDKQRASRRLRQFQ